MDSDKRLSELKPRQTTHEEKCDILLQLVDLALDGGEIGADPSEILLRGENRVEVPPSCGTRNLAMMPPEVIRACAAGNPMLIGLSQKWFLIGMMAYYLYYGEDYYVRNRLSLLDMDSFLQRRTSVIKPDEAIEIPFCAQVSALTSVEERKRDEGVTAFLSYLERDVPKNAEIHFVCNGREIRAETYQLTQKNYKNPVGRAFFLDKGVKYAIPSPLNVQYRPGTYRYTVEVTASDPRRRRNGP